jgi:hypothetical protein
MNTTPWNVLRIFAILLGPAPLLAAAADSVVAQFKPAGTQGEVALHSTLALPVSAMYGEYRVLRSTNLQTWEIVAGPLNGRVGVSDELLQSVVPLAGQRAFYRVVANVKLAPAGGGLGDAIYGYGTEFGRQIQSVGQLPLEEFAAAYTPTNQYLAQISFDPAAADYWTNFNTSSLQLNTIELSLFQTNGFVVSQRLGTYSFGDSFYTIFTRDLPVFLSCDAVLHAWHRSYMGMLEELEESSLAPTLDAILEGMSGQVSALWSQSYSTALRNGVLDADYFLAVARSLLTGTNDFGWLGQNAQIRSTLTAISNLQPASITVFGTNRTVDFSQFQVRGHYQTSQRLARYFQAMMWCGLFDFRFTGSTNDNSLRELSGAVAMHFLLKNSWEFADWQQIDQVVQMFVGPPDSLNFAQLSDLLTAAGIQSPANLASQAALQNLQSQLMSGQLGTQNIQSGFFLSPLTRQQIKLPRSFTVLGQRFVLDAWAMNQCVFDRIIWDTDGIPGVEDKVMRRVPSALDVAFSVLGNSQTVPDLTARIANSNGLAWRDGFPYQHNLAAVRQVVDLQNASAWTNNIYNDWLACLRELSLPTTDVQYPDAMRTRAWAMKTLNTQLASWTELRHDTVLYAKQPYTGQIVCSYPDGFIEPRISFWQRMSDMARRTRNLAAALPTDGDVVFEPNDSYSGPFTNSLASISASRLQFLDNFAACMTTLRDISIKELNRQVLSSNETFFIQSLIENPSQYGSVRSYSGWYSTIFYRNARAARSVISTCDMWDSLVTDVQTDPTDLFVGDPGCVVHEGVGTVDLLMVAVNWGTNDTGVYAGPVLSHYEFEMGPSTRKTDSEWKSELRAGTKPPSPDWTRNYLVPGSFAFPPWIY